MRLIESWLRTRGPPKLKKRLGLELDEIFGTLARSAAPGAWLACAALAAVAALALIDPFGLRQRADWLVSDQFLRVRHAPQMHADIYLIAIDDGAVERFGFPLPRSVLAGTIRQLQRLEARTILVDILFTEPQHKPVLDESEAWLLPFGSILSDAELGDRLNELKRNFSEDQVLARAIGSAGSVIIPFSFLSAERQLGSNDITASDDALSEQLISALRRNPALSPVELATQLGQDEKRIRPKFGPALDAAMEQLTSRQLEANPKLVFADLIAATLPDGLEGTVVELSLQRAFDRARAEQMIRTKGSVAIPVHGGQQPKIFAEQIKPPRSIFTEAAAGLGFADIPLDDDGTLRRLRLATDWSHRLVLHQSLVAALKHHGTKLADARFKSDQIETASGATLIPAEVTSCLNIDWPLDWRRRWSEVIPMISLTDIFSMDQVEADLRLLRHRRREFFKEMAKLVVREQKWQELFDQILMFQRQGRNDDAAQAERTFDLEVIPQIEQLPDILQAMSRAATSDPPGANEPSEPGLVQYARAMHATAEQIAARQGEYEASLSELRSILRGKLCLIGDTTTGSADLKRTPVDQAIPGVAVNAAAISSMLSGTQLAIFGYPASALLLLVVAGVLVWPFLRLSALISGACAIAGMAAAFFGSYLLLETSSMFVSPVTPLLGIATLYLTTTTYRWLREYREKKLVRTIFEAQTNPMIVERLIEAGHAGVEEVLAPKNRQVTVFFAELADYDELVRQVTAERLPELLSRTFGTMAKLVLAHEGTLDRYQGHAMVAFFGAPVYQSDHAQRACRAALECCDTLRGLDSTWHDRGLPAPRVHIGIHTGELLVGNLTLTSRVDYTVAGENLNVAYRIGELNEVYGTQIMLSEASLLRCENMVEARELDMVRIKGRRDPIRAFELMSAKGRLSSDQLQMRGTFSTGLIAFRNKDFAAALAMFRTCRETAPGDRPATVYIERCERELSITSPTLSP
jgi:class 3 adenylate cyclase/CHASE2 domain-containing sensor protein